MIGRHYTPEPLAAEVVRRTLWPLRGRRVRILDPACGDGVFLREAARYLGTDDGIVGVDVDGEALARARQGFAGQLIHADALRYEWGEQRFDAVIGNPPWVSWSGRHAHELADADRDYYERAFETFSGWPSLHGLFLELAVRLSRGRVGFLLPTQVCDLEGYGAVRAHVRRHCRVVEVLDCGEQAFVDVVQPCCALVLARGGGAPDPAPFAHAVAHALDALPKPPQEMFGDIGVHTGNCARKLLRPGGLPVREGRDVHAFRLDAPRKTLVPDPPHEKGDYFRVAPIDRYQAVPILLRQTAARPIAALHRDPGYFRNSVLACRGLPDVAPELVVAWLNSTAVAEYHKTKVREAGQRTFPQLKLKHLRDLPMPEWDEVPPDVRELARAVTRKPELARRLDVSMSGWLHSTCG